MSPYWRHFARRNWQSLAALAGLLVFAIVHDVVFRPALARYQSDVQQAARLEMPLDAAGARPAASARVTALLAGNSLTPAVAEEQGVSGALTAGLLDQMTRLAARSGLEVLATEQGLVTQLPGSAVVHAHLRLQGRYADFVGLLGALARSGSLLSVDRFTLQAGPGNGQSIEIWASQLILKRRGGTQ